MYYSFPLKIFFILRPLYQITLDCGFFIYYNNYNLHEVLDQLTQFNNLTQQYSSLKLHTTHIQKVSVHPHLAFVKIKQYTSLEERFLVDPSKARNNI